MKILKRARNVNQDVFQCVVKENVCERNTNMVFFCKKTRQNSPKFSTKEEAEQWIYDDMLSSIKDQFPEFYERIDSILIEGPEEPYVQQDVFKLLNKGFAEVGRVSIRSIGQLPKIVIE
jgi:hypothetical protein